MGGWGSYGSSGVQFLTGSLDEIKIYNKALTAEGIREDYQEIR